MSLVKLPRAWQAAGQAIPMLLGERKVRVFRTEQVARWWFSHTKHPKRGAMDCVRALARAGLIKLRQAMLHPEVDLLKPLFEHLPHEPEPVYGKISWQAKSRFHFPPVRTCVITAGPKLDPNPRPLRSTELLHDTMVTEVFLRLLAREDDALDRWVHEDAFFRDGSSCVPDAVWLSPQGEATLIECIGAYSARKIERLCAAYATLPYKLY